MTSAIDVIDPLLLRRLADEVEPALIAAEVRDVILANPQWWLPGRRGASSGALVSELSRGIAMMIDERVRNPWWEHGEAALSLLDHLEEWSGAVRTTSCQPPPTTLPRNPPRLGIDGIGDTRLIGAWTAGMVYEARLNDRWTVALRVLPNLRVDDAAIAAVVDTTFRHPNVAALVASGTTTGGEPYLITSWLPGDSVAQRLVSTGPLLGADVLEMLVFIGSSVHALHRAGRIHGGIRPSVIRGSPFGVPQLADLGVAELLAADRIVPRPVLSPHIAPEVLDGGPPSLAGDQFSLASTALHALAGRPRAHVGLAGLTQQTVQALRAPVPREVLASMPPQVAHLLERAMHPDPTARFPDVAALVSAVQRAQHDLSLPVTPLPAVPDEYRA